MAEKCNCGCLLPWLSGFFAMPAIAHLIRILAKMDVLIGGEPFSMKHSWMIVIGGGVLSLICGGMACMRHKKEGQGAGCC